MIKKIVNNRAMANSFTMMFGGDLVLDEPDAAYWLSGVSEIYRSADLSICHLETPHTRRGTELEGDVPAPGADPDNLDALTGAGISLVTLAGNHIADCGPQGIADTLAKLDALGIAHCGAGLTIEKAREPAMIERHGRRIAVVSYNCVGPETAWATDAGYGCSYLPIETADHAPVSPTAKFSRPAKAAFEILRTDVDRVRRKADIVIVALHKGIVHTPARLDSYERPIAQAAIDAGADIVLGHHAHIIRGIELYNGRPIFHGLGNACVVTRALSPDQSHAKRSDWAKKRKELFGFEPDPDYPLAPFHPEAVNAMIGCVEIMADGKMKAGMVPIFVEPPGRPVVADTEEQKRIAGYVEKITAEAGLGPIKLVKQGRIWSVL